MSFVHLKAVDAFCNLLPVNDLFRNGAQLVAGLVIEGGVILESLTLVYLWILDRQLVEENLLSPTEARLRETLLQK